jgi:hypothetical protein
LLLSSFFEINNVGFRSHPSIFLFGDNWCTGVLEIAEVLVRRFRNAEKKSNTPLLVYAPLCVINGKNSFPAPTAARAFNRALTTKAPGQSRGF